MVHSVWLCEQFIYVLGSHPIQGVSCLESSFTSPLFLYPVGVLKPFLIVLVKDGQLDSMLQSKAFRTNKNHVASGMNVFLCTFHRSAFLWEKMNPREQQKMCNKAKRHQKGHPPHLWCWLFLTAFWLVFCFLRTEKWENAVLFLQNII